MDFKGFNQGDGLVPADLATGEGLAEDLAALFVELSVLVLAFLSLFSLLIALV